MIRKFRFYEQYGVEEYYVYNPDNGSLDGWLRVSSRLEEIPEISGFVSPRLGIRFEPGEGSDSLVIVGPDGARFLTFAEWVEKGKTAERKAEIASENAEEQKRLAAVERDRAEQERDRADQARQRAEHLAVQLRELGIEPDEK